MQGIYKYINEDIRVNLDDKSNTDLIETIMENAIDVMDIHTTLIEAQADLEIQEAASLLNEGINISFKDVKKLGDKVSKFFSVIMDKLIETIQNFKEILRRVFKKDARFLSKYKSDLLKWKPRADLEFEDMFNFNKNFKTDEKIDAMESAMDNTFGYIISKEMKYLTEFASMVRSANIYKMTPKEKFPEALQVMQAHRIIIEKKKKSIVGKECSDDLFMKNILEQAGAHPSQKITMIGTDIEMRWEVNTLERAANDIKVIKKYEGVIKSIKSALANQTKQIELVKKLIAKFKREDQDYYSKYLNEIFIPSRKEFIRNIKLDIMTTNGLLKIIRRRRTQALSIMKVGLVEMNKKPQANFDLKALPAPV